MISESLMPPFALALAPDVRREALAVIGALFTAFVVISFLAVAAYTGGQITRRRLLAPENAPLPLSLEPRAAGWLFILCVGLEIYLQSILFPFVVMVGVGAALAQSRRTAEIQFGFNRLPIVRALAYALLVFGAVMLVEAPLTALSDQLLTFLRVPHPQQEAVDQFQHLREASQILWFVFQAVIFSPFIEEIFFRGFCSPS